MKKNLLYSLILAFGALFLSTNVVWAQCASGQSEITISLDQSGDGFPDEDGWRLINVTDGITVDSACFGTYASNSGIVTITTCVDTGKTYVFYAYDDFGDGLDGASYALSYSFGSSIGTLGTNNFNIPASLCNPTYSNNELCDSLSFSAIYVAAPACLPATALSASSIGSDSALLGWTENNSSTSWQIEWGASGFTQGTGTTVITGNNPYSLTGLSPATAYDWYVRSICGPADTSSWSIVNTFTTNLQGPQGISCTSGNPGIIFVEDFEATGGWTGDIAASGAENWIYRSGGTPSSGTGPNGAHSGSQYVFVETSGAGVGTPVSLVSPAIDMSAGLQAAELSFWLHAVGAQIGTLSVGVGTSATGPFTSVFTYSGPIQAAQADPYVNVGADLTAYLGQTIYLEFLYTTNGGYRGDIAIDLVEITSCVNCPAPSNLSATNVTADSATLAWTENGTATQWEVEFGTNGYTLGSGTSVVTTSNPHILTGLTPVTVYDYYVRAICGPGDTSGFVGPISFTTACAVVTAPFFDDVEAHAFASPISSSLCWTATANNSSNDWNVSTSGTTPSSGTGPNSAYSGTNFFFFEASGGATGNEGLLVSPEVDVTALTLPMIEFYYHMHGDNRGLMGDLYIDVFDGTNYTVVDSIKGEQQVNQGDPFLKRQIDLPSATGVIQVRFRAYRGSGAQWGDIAIDDISVKEKPNCVSPTMLTNSGVAADSSYLAWTENGTATQWEISYGATGFTAGNGTQVISNSNPDTLSGLMPATTYQWYVRSICGPGDTSTWTGPASFSTSCPPALMAPLTETFDANGTPICWSQSAVQDGPWVFGGPGFTWNTLGCSFVPSDHTGNGGTFAALDFSGSGVVDVVLEMPEVNVSALTNPYLEFYFAMCGNGYSPINILYVDAWDGTTWNIVDSIQENTNGWKAYGFNLGSHVYNTNLVRLRLRASSAGNTVTMYLGDQAIDDLSIKEAPADNLEMTSIVRPTGGCGSSASDSVEVVITNVGAAAQSNFPVAYVINGGTPVTGTFTGTIAPGASSNFVFATTANLSAVGVYNITAYTQLTGDVDNLNDTARTSVTSIGNSSTMPYSESFESGPAGWVVEGANTSWELGVPANTIINSASNGTQAWVTDLDANYGDGEVGFVNSPCFDFSSLTNPYINLDIWYDIETSWDGAVLQSSIDNGASWQLVGALNDPNNWYNDGTIDALSASGVELSEDGWSGSPGSLGWLTAGNFLSGLAGQSSVRLRIAFVSDGNTNDEGMAFDNVHVFDSIIPDPYYPIGTINTEDANGVADSLNVVCWTSGTVYGVDLDGNNGLSFHIIDMSSGSQEGINVFNFNDVSNYVVTEGDSIRIHGPVIQFNGLTELNVDSIEIIKTNAFLPMPNLVTDLDESTESQLIRLTNLSVTAASSATASSVNYTVTNGTNTMTIRVDGDTDVHDSLRWVAGDTICSVIGIGGQFDNSNPYTSGYQLFPMRFGDIDTCVTTGIQKQVGLADYAIYPNPSEGEFTLRTSGFNSSIVNLEILDLNGRVIQDMQLNNAKSAQVTKINLNGVAKGIYFLAIQDGDTRKIEKLIVR